MLDERVRKLADTVFSAGLDWLGAEIIEGALAGRIEKEPEEVLAAAREMAGRHYQDRGLKVSDSGALKDPVPFSAEEQLDWACAHLESRLADAIAMMKASVDNVDGVIDGEDGIPAQAVTTLVLDGPDDQSKVTRAQLEAAQKDLEALQVAILEWANSVRSDPQ